MTIRITDDDMATVFSELTAHRDLPINHPDCEFCDWVREFSKTQHGQAFAEESGDSTEYLNRLFFLFAGVRIGRKQGADDLISDINAYGTETAVPLEDLMKEPWTHEEEKEDDDPILAQSIYNAEVEEAAASAEETKSDFEFGGGESGGGGAGGDF